MKGKKGKDVDFLKDEEDDKKVSGKKDEFKEWEEVDEEDLLDGNRSKVERNPLKKERELEKPKKADEVDMEKTREDSVKAKGETGRGS